ncbi:MAG TPA: LamG-like jellyroll fold domain-containing protein [Thermoanaerobaculia bacterium]|nr:LamG-like jellyroll fold domain-containing protein [Thermoanaerobaculia bacterium]
MTHNSSILRPPPTSAGQEPAFARARRRRATLAAVLCSLVAGVAAAQSEQFIYPLGSSINLNGGTGWSGPWNTNGAVVVQGLTYPNLGALGNALGPTPGSAAVRSFTTPVVGAAGTSVMLSALIRSPVAGNPATQATLGNSAGGTFIIGDLPQPDAAAGTWGVQTGAGRFYSNVPVLANQTTYLVALIDFNVAGSNDRIRLWVNPPANGWFTTQPKIDDSSSDVPTFSGVFWQTQQGQSVDEIRVARTSTACVAPPNTTMVAWYPFDETSGTVADNLATQNDGFYGDQPTPVAGLVNGALRFDGINDYVFSPSSIVTNFGPRTTPTPSGLWSAQVGNFSIDVWVRIPLSVSPSQLMVILDKRLGNVPAIKGYSLFVQNNRIGLQLADAAAPPGFDNYLSSPLLNGGALYDDNWHHLAVTVNRINNQGMGIRFYHNGVLLSAANPSNRQGSLANASPMAIGTRSASPALTGWYEGTLDELEVFNRVLLAGEVAGIYAAGPFGKCKK